jgi:hypothetical protein
VVKDGIMVGGYGLHNDQSGLCCLCNDEAKVEGSNQQDGPEYMTVVTYVISSTKIRHTKVVWKNGHMEWKEIVIDTGDKDIHFQAVYCQTCSKQQVDVIPRIRGKCSNSDYRVVFSGRATMHFKETKEMRLEHTRTYFFGKKSDLKGEKLPNVRKNYKYINVLHEGLEHFEKWVVYPVDKDKMDKEQRGEFSKTRSLCTNPKKKDNVNMNEESEDDIQDRGGKAKREKECISGSSIKKMKVVKMTMPSDTYPNAPHHVLDPIWQHNPGIIEDAIYKLENSEALYTPQIAEKCIMM